MFEIISSRKASGHLSTPRWVGGPSLSSRAPRIITLMATGDNFRDPSPYLSISAIRL